MENLNSGETKAEGVTRHRVVRRARGKASDYPCWSCLENGIVILADVWATIHGETGSDPWSDYVPLCNSCHRIYDKQLKGEEHGMAMLSDSDVREIRRRFRAECIKSGVSVTPVPGLPRQLRDPQSGSRRTERARIIRYLAEEFGVSSRHLRGIVDGNKRRREARQ